MARPIIGGVELKAGAPNLGVPLISTTTYRPLGKSPYLDAPWSTHEHKAYKPTNISVKAMKIGLEKASEPMYSLREDIKDKVFNHMISELRKIWILSAEEFIIPFEDAVSELSPDKSPGYPYYFDCNTKLEALDKYYDKIKEETSDLLSGCEVESLFSLTEKAELRQSEKVDAHKTRVFMASPLPHLLASIQLFFKQNEILMEERIENFVGTIGIQIPGPEFVRLLTRLGDRVNDADISGCDLRFNLEIAGLIRDVRASFLPGRYAECINWLYDCVYAGNCVALGGIYQVNGNKSGWFNTGQDNTLQTWAMILYGYFILCERTGRLEDPAEMRHFVNSDDLVGDYNGLLGDLILILKEVNFILETNSLEPRSCFSATFLSHHLEKVYVDNFGDFLVAAGNLPKILSSRDWIKKSTVLTHEEVCVAHLLGIRMCLFPWQIEFDECDAILSDYLKQIVITPSIRNLLNARLDVQQLARLHTRVESSSLFLAGLNLSKYFTSVQIVELESLLYPEDITSMPDKRRLF